MNIQKYKNERNSNIELLRIVSIFMIIFFHYAYKGGWSFDSFTLNEFIIKIFWMFGELGVNLFVLITGYFMSQSSFKVKKLILLVLEVLFYHFLTRIVAYLLGIYSFPNSIREWIILFLPITLNNYWFITAYILIYVLSPFINIFIGVLATNKKIYIKFLLLVLILYSVIPTFVGCLFNDTETILYYTRLLWLIIIYFVGAYIHLYPIRCLKRKKNSIIGSGIVFGGMILSILIIERYEEYFMVLGTYETAYFWRPNTILMFLLSIFVFHIFLYMEIPSNKIINCLSSTTLGIYILHDGILQEYLWRNLFRNSSYQNSPFLVVHIVISSVLIFTVGVTIDLFRQLIEKYTIRRFLDSAIAKRIFLYLRNKSRNIIDFIETKL